MPDANKIKKLTDAGISNADKLPDDAVNVLYGMSETELRSLAKAQHAAQGVGTLGGGGGSSNHFGGVVF
jgi:hypothetical protein